MSAKAVLSLSRCKIRESLLLLPTYSNCTFKCDPACHTTSFLSFCTLASTHLPAKLTKSTSTKNLLPRRRSSSSSSSHKVFTGGGAACHDHRQQLERGEEFKSAVCSLSLFQAPQHLLCYAVHSAEITQPVIMAHRTVRQYLQLHVSLKKHDHHQMCAHWLQDTRLALQL